MQTLGTLAYDHVRHLAAGIGTRLIGTPAHHAAADYIAAHLARAGLAVERQDLPCPNWEEVSASLEMDGHVLEAYANTFSPSGLVSAPTLALGTPAELAAADITGRLLIFYGALAQHELAASGAIYISPRDRAILRLLDERRPAGLITVNPSLHAHWRLVEDYDLALPSVTVTPRVGMALVARANEVVQLRVETRSTPGHTANLVGWRPGPRPERLVVCAHYDSKVGTPDVEAGVIRFLTNFPGQWRGVPLAAQLEERLGLRAALINDVRGLTLAEWSFGAGRGVDTLACLALGTGIGGGLVVGGQLHLGLDATAGEFGHQVVEPHGPPCGCGGRGCLELYASGPAIAAQAVKAVLHGHTTRLADLCGRDLNRLSAELVVQAAADGDALAADILARAGGYVGLAVANIITAVSPQKVLFGGGVARAGDWLLAHVRRVVTERVHVVNVDRIELATTALGDQGGLIGAALWARQSIR